MKLITCRITTYLKLRRNYFVVYDIHEKERLRFNTMNRTIEAPGYTQGLQKQTLSTKTKLRVFYND